MNSILLFMRYGSRYKLGRCPLKGSSPPWPARLKSDSRTKNQSFRKTLNLPRTKFPLSMKDGVAPKREVEVQSVCQFPDLYTWQKEQSRDQEFILHDGPPYANGDPHVGHALNKILKDITLRYKVLTGHKVHYVPGWDCHGMPIEQKALAHIKKSHTELDPLEIRNNARDFAQLAVQTQKNAFQRWGVMADWEDGCYYTYTKEYVSHQLDVFHKMYENGVIYQDYMPVFWSPASRTALAEAELEYNDQHISTSVYMRFPIIQLPDTLKGAIDILGISECYALIWTTTPWTLPANKAISYGPGIKYSFVRDKDSNETYLVCSEFKEKLSQLIGPLEDLRAISGNELAGTNYSHPLHGGQVFPFLSGDHVTVEKGTGLVHTAPAHGPEDFQVAVKHGLSVEGMVDEGGCYSKEAGPHLEGKSVLGDANDAVISLLGSDILHQEKLVHSYPYDWRSKTPVIYRASNQWFVNTNKIKERALEVLEDIEVIPKSMEAGMISQLERRTYWCISRQRVWGVPIPVFYRKSDGAPLISSASINHLKYLLAKYGTDFWWTLSMEELLPKHVTEESNFSHDDTFVRGDDILDIWFDSGCSWAPVLKGKQADVYMEGLDQFGGWFQSSLLTSMAAQNKPPYKKIVVHGFVMDEEGKKMSKSLGNVVDPEIIINGSKDEPAYGADVLRWWAAQAGLDVNVNIGPSVIKLCHEQVFRVRKALRFLLGNLYDYDHEEHQIAYEDLLPVDKYMLHLSHRFTRQVSRAYTDFLFSRAAQLIDRHVSIDVSSFHSHISKDRLYCSVADSFERRSGQTAQYHALQGLLQAVAPILPHLTEEAFFSSPPQHIPGVDSFFKTNWQSGDMEWNNPELEDVFKLAFSMRDAFYGAIGSDNPNKYDVIISPSSDVELQILQDDHVSFTSQLSEVFQCSQVTLLAYLSEDIENDASLVEGSYSYEDDREPVSFKLVIRRSEKEQCDRCRKYTAENKGELCDQCTDNISHGWDQ